jgi:transposase InsO family protein
MCWRLADRSGFQGCETFALSLKPRPNTWAMDFIHDELATGHKLRVLTIVDTFARFSPRWSHGSPSAAPTLWRYWCESSLNIDPLIQNQSST